MRKYVFLIKPATTSAAGDAPDQPDSVLADYSPSSPVLENVRCLYAFEGNNPEELPFVEQEELEILGKPTNDPEWWVARNQQGRIGLVPRIYTEVIEQTYPGTIEYKIVPCLSFSLITGLLFWKLFRNLSKT